MRFRLLDDADGEIEAALDQVRRGGRFDQVDLDGGVGGEEGGEAGNDVPLGEAVGRPDAQPAGRLLVRRLRLVPGARRVVEGGGSCGRRRGPLRSAGLFRVVRSSRRTPIRSSSARTVSLTDDFAVCSEAAAAVKLPRSTTAAKASMPAKESMALSFAVANDLSRTAVYARRRAGRIRARHKLEETDMTETLDVLGAPMMVKREAGMFIAETRSRRAISCRRTDMPTTRRCST